ncbi:YdcF family protein [Motilimonas pumila]|uniref:YdcF family protein n=1 Tax=Motilimonas pumila TaxID=2303987 RepID=A0A418YKJ0_9GAMM|nr:YdcF family protein [Motilimonas pumila]RJG51504.1 YdcF family protein [Motilimonas pumila]
MTQTVDQHGQILWDFLSEESELKPASCIIVMGSIDTRTAERAAQCMLSGLAPVVVFSGNCGRNTEGLFQQTEAELFAEKAVSLGVDPSQVLIEPKATNTGENVKFAMALLAEKGIAVDSVILVHKNFATKRAYATFKQHFDGIEVMVTGPSLTYQTYPNAIISRELFLHTLVGDMQRMKLYPELGHQMALEIPSNAWQSYLALRDLGYTEQIVN